MGGHAERADPARIGHRALDRHRDARVLRRRDHLDDGRLVLAPGAARRARWEDRARRRRDRARARAQSRRRARRRVPGALALRPRDGRARGRAAHRRAASRLRIDREHRARLGTSERQIRVVRDREGISLGAVHRHADRVAPLQFRPPARARLGDRTSPSRLAARAGVRLQGRRGVGAASHPRGSFLVVGSAGYLGRIDGFAADTCSSASAGSARRAPTIASLLARERSSARIRARIIPIHWDSRPRRPRAVPRSRCAQGIPVAWRRTTRSSSCGKRPRIRPRFPDAAALTARRLLLIDPRARRAAR